MSYRTTVFEQNYHRPLVELFFLEVCMLISHARIQSLKESRVVAIESFSNELKQNMHKCCKTRSFRNIGGTYALSHIY